MLVDTSVWVEHFRKGHPGLVRLLEEGKACTHPHVVGELACGTLPRRAGTLALLSRLPAVRPASDAEVLAFLDAHALHGQGLGWIDLHLLAAARLGQVPLLTLDQPLARAAARLGLGT